MSDKLQQEYMKALEVIKAYPNAIKTIIDYHNNLEFSSKVNESFGTIDLTIVISNRSINILKKYFFNAFHIEIDLFKFPVSLLAKINLTKLKLTRTCGVATVDEVKILIDKYYPKVK